MSENESAGSAKGLSGILRLDREKIGKHLGAVVRDTVEETSNALLEAEADRLCGARRTGGSGPVRIEGNLVRPAGLEPATRGLRVRCSTELS